MTESQTDHLENEARDENVSAPLADTHVTVPPMKQWRGSALSAMQRGDFETWAEKTLDAKSFDRWQDVDPTIEEIEEFFERLMPKFGLDRGKSARSSGSSRGKRKR